MTTRVKRSRAKEKVTESAAKRQGAKRNNQKKAAPKKAVSVVAAPVRTHAGISIDSNFFQNLTAEDIGKHVFPITIIRATKIDIIEHFKKEIFSVFGLRLDYSKQALKWFPDTVDGNVCNVRHVPKFHNNNSRVDLYCSDCRDCRDCRLIAAGKQHGKLFVVATLEFQSTAHSHVEGRVAALYFHNIHNEGAALNQLMSSGWCIVNTPFAKTDLYQKAIDHCRDFLYPPHNEVEVEQHPNLLHIGHLDGNKIRPPDNRYYLLMSAAGSSWDKTVPNNCCNDDHNGDALVRLSLHRQVIVSLFYSWCNRLGFASIAEAFVYDLKENYEVKVFSEKVPNPFWRLFCNEDFHFRLMSETSLFIAITTRSTYSLGGMWEAIRPPKLISIAWSTLGCLL
jgi:hypothetical protein